jgi:phosphoglycolate phosphatase
VIAVFDLDGTLVDSAELFATILNDMLQARGAGRRIVAAQTRREVNRGGPGMVAALLGPECGDPTSEIAEFRARYAQTEAPRSIVFPGVEVGLRDLARQGVRLSICSSKPQALCEKTLGDVGLFDLFDGIVGSQPQLAGKPDPAQFDKALQLVGGRRADSCLIGDEVVDQVLAQNVGVPFVLAAYGYGESETSFEGALRAETFADVANLVKNVLHATYPALAAAAPGPTR